jgi:hypothetical protein
MERPLDDLISHVRTIKIAGIDVVYPRRNRLSQDGNRSVNIVRRSLNLRPGQLHRAIAHPVHVN